MKLWLTERTKAMKTVFFFLILLKCQWYTSKILLKTGDKTRLKYQLLLGRILHSKMFHGFWALRTGPFRCITTVFRTVNYYEASTISCIYKKSGTTRLRTRRSQPCWILPGVESLADWGSHLRCCSSRCTLGRRHIIKLCNNKKKKKLQRCNNGVWSGAGGLGSGNEVACKFVGREAG